MGRFVGKLAMRQSTGAEVVLFFAQGCAAVAVFTIFIDTHVDSNNFGRSFPPFFPNVFLFLRPL
jgi:hypothetical protein